MTTPNPRIEIIDWDALSAREQGRIERLLRWLGFCDKAREALKQLDECQLALKTRGEEQEALGNAAASNVFFLHAANAHSALGSLVPSWEQMVSVAEGRPTSVGATEAEVKNARNFVMLCEAALEMAQAALADDDKRKKRARARLEQAGNRMGVELVSIAPDDLGRLPAEA